MSIHIYCPRKSDGAFALKQALQASRLRRFDGENFWDKGRRVRTEEGDVVICWGTHLPDLHGLRVLNSMEKRLNKYEQAVKFVGSGVPTVRVVDAKGLSVSDGEQYVRAGYVPRTKDHTGGLDLLGIQRNGEVGFFVEKQTFVDEVRIHSFSERSIRAGRKIPRDGFRAVETEAEWKPNEGLLHPWVRSYDGGWKISYDGFKSTEAMRNMAHSAVKALGLVFGAVDLGITKSGSLVVLEVNTAPGIEGGTLHSYVRAINRWVAAKPKKVEQPE